MVYGILITGGKMKIVVVSDSHGRPNILESIAQQYSHADMLLHCGDIECEAECYPQYAIVQGNNDLFYEIPKYRVIQAGNHRIFMIHGHQYSYMKRLYQLADEAIAHGCDIVCYGHTHIAAEDTIKGVRLINPGSLFYNRDGRPPSYAIMDLDDESIHVEFIFLPQEKKKSLW